MILEQDPSSNEDSSLGSASTLENRFQRLDGHAWLRELQNRRGAHEQAELRASDGAES